MKLAILYSGHIRSFDKCKSYHKLFIDKLKETFEVNVFVQTYKKKESTSLTWWNKSPNFNTDFISESDLEILNPNKLLIQNEFFCDNQPNFFVTDGSYEGICSMVKSFENSYHLLDQFRVEHNWQPDLIIKIRFDIVFDVDVMINAIKSLKKEEIGIFVKAKNSYIYGGVSDVLFAHRYNIPFNNISYFFFKDPIIQYFRRYRVFYMELFLRQFFLKNNACIYIKPNLKILRLHNDSEVKIDMNRKSLFNFLYDLFEQFSRFKKNVL